MDRVTAWVLRRSYTGAKSLKRKASLQEILDLKRDAIKVVVLGAAGVGKTSLIRRLCREPKDDEAKSSIYDVYQKQFNHENATLRLEITDMTGEYSFPAMERLAISRADVFVLVYSVDDIKTLDEVNRLRRNIVDIKQKHSTEIPLIVVGNKIDLRRKSAQYDNESDNKIKEWCFSHLRTSVQTETNLFEFEETLVRECISHIMLSIASSKTRKLSGKLVYKDNLKRTRSRLSLPGL